MLRWLWLSGLVVVIDQLTKQIVENKLLVFETVPVLPFFNLTLVYNEGAAFSMLADQGGWQRWFFVLLAVVISIVLTVWLARLERRERLTAAAFALIIGGAIGNLIDRIVLGRVIDFLDFYYTRYHWPAFNVADSAIFLGVVLMLWETVLQSRRERAES